MTASPVIVEDDSVASKRCSCGAWILGGRRHTCRQRQVSTVPLTYLVLGFAAGLPLSTYTDRGRIALQADWAHLSSDVLSAVVLKSNLDTHKHMHLVCNQWTTSVLCNLHTMLPSVLSTEQLKLYFPALRHLFLHKVTFAQNSTLCLATVRHLQTLSLKSCTFDQCESVAELAALSGILDQPIGRHCYCSATYGLLDCRVAVPARLTAHGAATLCSTKSKSSASCPGRSQLSSSCSIPCCMRTVMLLMLLI